MTLTARKGTEIAIVQINCEPNGEDQNCALAGVRIYKSDKKPMGARFHPSGSHDECWNWNALSASNRTLLAGSDDEISCVRAPVMKQFVRPNAQKSSCPNTNNLVCRADMRLG